MQRGGQIQRPSLIVSPAYWGRAGDPIYNAVLIGKIRTAVLLYHSSGNL
jgi:hypothetical protein